jgi:hypothetical protein
MSAPMGKLVRSVRWVTVRLIMGSASSVRPGPIPREPNAKRAPGIATSAKMARPVTGVLTVASSIQRQMNVSARRASSCQRTLKSARPAPKIAIPALTQKCASAASSLSTSTVSESASHVQKTPYTTSHYKAAGRNTQPQSVKNALSLTRLLIAVKSALTTAKTATIRSPANSVRLASASQTKAHA